MSVLVLQIIRVQQCCQFPFVSREKEYERLGGWQGVCGRVARHLCSYHVRVWQCRTVGEHKIQTSKYKQSITKYKLQRNTNTCVLIMFGCGSVAQSVGATKYWIQTSKKKRNKLCLQVMVNWVELCITRCWARRPMATCFLSISAGIEIFLQTKLWLILIYLKLKQSNFSF